MNVNECHLILVVMVEEGLGFWRFFNITVFSVFCAYVICPWVHRLPRPQSSL